MQKNREILWQTLLYQGKRELMQVRQTNGREQKSALVRLVNLILDTAIANRASDIHLEPQADCLRVRYRIDGLLREDKHTLAREFAPGLLSRLKVMAGMDIAQHQRPQDGHLRYESQNRTLDVRVSSLPGIYGETMVLRLMDLTAQQLTLENLGFTAENYQQLVKLIARPAGLFIVCGPMNSGKTTTLYAVLSKLNRPEKSIVTLEDPIEREIAGLHQVQMHPKAGLDYVAGLKAILRQDAECILLGEIRDDKTAAMAVRIALTGHLLLTTLHTEDTISAIFRLLEMGVEPYLLAATLSGVMAQRLVRRICPHCKEQYVVAKDSAEAALLGKQDIVLYRGKGCEHCQGTGYLGRLALHELLIVTPELREAVVKQADRQALERLADKAGRKTLWQDGVAKVLQGETTLAEVRRVIYG